jgi:uncharacterized cofD-like protein
MVDCGESTRLTAVVTMTDDGGSSGRLRRSLGLPPPGDVRNCLVALAEEEDLLSALFTHRYRGADELDGHNLGNLILAALAEQSGSFVKAVELSSRVLRTAGQILPATFDNVFLEAELADGRTVRGETAIDACGEPIERISVCPPRVTATPGVIEAILDADLVVVGPGSLYTSVLPNLVVDGITAALLETRAVVVMVGNLVTEPGTRILDLVEHLAIVKKHAGSDVMDALLVHEGPLEPSVVERYAAEGSRPLTLSRQEIDGVRIVRRPLVAAGAKLRHDPRATANGVLEAWAAVKETRRRRSTASGGGRNARAAG